MLGFLNVFSDATASDPGLAALAEAASRGELTIVVVEVREVPGLLFNERLDAGDNLLVLVVRTILLGEVIEDFLTLRAVLYCSFSVVLHREIIDLNLELSLTQVLVDAFLGGGLDPRARRLAMHEVLDMD